MARSGLFEDDEMYRQWDKIDKEPNVSPLAGDDYEIEMPEGPITMIEICPGWSVNSVSAAKFGLIIEMLGNPESALHRGNRS